MDINLLISITVQNPALSDIDLMLSIFERLIGIAVAIIACYGRHEKQK